MGLTRSMALEWGGRGITANTVSPTVTWTELGRKAWGEEGVREDFLRMIPVGRFALPGEVADAVDFLCQVRRMEGFLVPGGEGLNRKDGCVWLTNGFV